MQVVRALLEWTVEIRCQLSRKEEELTAEPQRTRRKSAESDSRSVDSASSAAPRLIPLPPATETTSSNALPLGLTGFEKMVLSYHYSGFGLGAVLVRSLVNISEAASLALHTMALLARAGEQRMTGSELAARLGASSHHLAKVMQRLSRVGLVDSVRGPQGGFRLGRPTDDVKLLEIFEAVEGPIGEMGCLLAEPICSGTDCVLGDFVQSVHQQIRDYLAKTDLTTLARGVALTQLLDKSTCAV